MNANAMPLLKSGKLIRSNDITESFGPAEHEITGLKE
jgi:hypothetical protein